MANSADFSQGSVSGGKFLNTPPPKYGVMKDWAEIAEIFQLKSKDEQKPCGSNADKTLYYTQMGLSGEFYLLFKGKAMYVANFVNHYFSDANLEIDQVIQKNLVDGILPLSVLVEFPRLKAVQTSENEIIESLKLLEHLIICPIGNQKGIRRRKENEIAPPQPQTVYHPQYNYNMTEAYTNMLPQSNINYFQTEFQTPNNMQSFVNAHAGHQQQAYPFLPDIAPLYTSPVQSNASATATCANTANLQQLMELMSYINPNAWLQCNAQLYLAQQNDYYKQIRNASLAVSAGRQNQAPLTRNSDFSLDTLAQALLTNNPHQEGNNQFQQVFTNTDAANGSVDAPQQMAGKEVTTTPDQTGNWPATAEDLSSHGSSQRQAESDSTWSPLL